MARSTNSTSYIQPFKSDGTVLAFSNTEFGRGALTLASGTTYFFPIGGADASVVSVHLQWDAAIAITSATIEDCNFPEGSADVDWWDDAAGEWIDEDPTTAFVGTDGAGATVTNGVLAVVAGSVGGAMWHVADTGARRTRLKVVVGATGGEVRVHPWGKQ